jgi:hypothetical protein
VPHHRAPRLAVSTAPQPRPGTKVRSLSASILACRDGSPDTGHRTRAVHAWSAGGRACLGHRVRWRTAEAHACSVSVLQPFCIKARRPFPFRASSVPADARLPRSAACPPPSVDPSRVPRVGDSDRCRLWRCSFERDLDDMVHGTLQSPAMLHRFELGF